MYVSTVRAPTGFVRCKPTRALYSVLVLTHHGFVPSAYVLVRECVQMSESVHMYGASPQEICASVYICTVRPQKDFVRCEPPRALYSVLVLAHQGFASSAYVLVQARVQMISCTRTYTYLRYELTSSLCFCAGGCTDELLYGNLFVCTVLAHNSFMQYASELVTRNEVFVWNQYACVSYTKTLS